ncbi:MAG: C39 family peptidase [Candidatus Pacebacteria bacterium]|nr:C39 family peptidase [Candidatus Paceibacterota bacterium]
MIKKNGSIEPILRTMVFVAIGLVLLTSLAGAYSNPLDVPFKSQVPPGTWSETKNCGQTSSLMIYSFYDETIPTEQGIKDIDDWLFEKYGSSQAINGYSGSNTNTVILETLAKEYGGFSDSYKASGWTIEKVKQEIDAGHPVIVAVTGAPLGQSYDGHFLVVKGYTDTGIITNDPGRTNGVITYSNKQFLNAMSSQGGAVVVVIDEPSPTSPKLDLIILIDTTGSMGGEINQVKVSANEIVEALDSTGFDYRVAVADYRDYPESPYGGSSDYLYNLNLPFSSNKDSIISSINGLTLGWGADWRESVYSALVMSMTDANKDITNSDNYGWRNGVSKAIIIMGDAPPHIPEPWIGGYALSDVTYWSENIDPIVVYSIVVGYDSTTYAAFSEISEGTGGKVYSAETASEVADAIIEAIRDIGTDDHGVNVEITPAHNEVSPEDSVAYSVNITNKGNIADVYNVSFEAENILGSYRGYPMAIQLSWIVFDSAQVTFNSEMSEVRPLTITVPENWAGMEDMVYSFDVTAISTTDTNIGNTSSAELKVKANNKSMIEYSKLEIQWLAELVDGSDIDRGIKNSLLTKLTNAESKADRALVDLDNGKIKTADNMLQASRNLINAFANQVDAQYDKKIMQPDAEILKEKANQIMEDLEKAKNN